MHTHQRTLAATAKCSGTGVHSGQNVNLRIKPAPINHGIKFVRVDLPDKPSINAHFNMVVDTSLATVIGQDGFIVSTIEHLMASFAGLAIDNAIVEIDGYEVPIMDGSAAPFAAALQGAGIKRQDWPRYYFVVKQPIELRENGKFVGIYPYEGLKISCTIDYQHPLINQQSFSLDLTEAAFVGQVCAARTFGFLYEIEYLKRFGLARGGSLDNAVVVDKTEIVNKDGLRFHDEFVRHKILDCIGDFALMGMPIMGHIVAHKSGHTFNQAFLQHFFKHKTAWETHTFPLPN